MFNRKRLNRERLEIYLVHLLLAYRRLFFIFGAALLLYALASMGRSLRVGIVLLVAAVFPLLLSYSHHAIVLVARVGAWIGTLGRKE